jgi:hypothetical protein
MASRSAKSLGSIAVIAVLILLVGLKKCFWSNSSNPAREADIRTELMSNRFSYTRHAKCRMKCREISEEEVNRILETGFLNRDKSGDGSGQCATYAFEGKTFDGQEIRVIFGNCPKTTKIITCIDLKQEHSCDCP